MGLWVPRGSSAQRWWMPHQPQSVCLHWGKPENDPWSAEAAAWLSVGGRANRGHLVIARTGKIMSQRATRVFKKTVMSIHYQVTSSGPDSVVTRHNADVPFFPPQQHLPAPPGGSPMHSAHPGSNPPGSPPGQPSPRHVFTSGGVLTTSTGEPTGMEKLLGIGAFPFPASSDTKVQSKRCGATL